MYNREMWFESPIQAAPTIGLGGMGLAGGIVTYQADGSASTWGSISTGLDQALQTAVKVTDQNGTPIVMSKFDNGWLANGCPLNVYFGSGWISGQQDALRQAGMTQCLPAAPLTQGTVPQSVTTLPPGGRAFTTTLTQGGIVTTPAATAPQTAVMVPGAPASPTMYDTGGAAPTPAPYNDFGASLPILAAIALGIYLISRKG